MRIPMGYKFISHEKTTVRVLGIHHQSHVSSLFLKYVHAQPPKHRFMTSAGELVLCR